MVYFSQNPLNLKSKKLSFQKTKFCPLVYGYINSPYLFTTNSPPATLSFRPSACPKPPSSLLLPARLPLLPHSWERCYEWEQASLFYRPQGKFFNCGLVVRWHLTLVNIGGSGGADFNLPAFPARRWWWWKGRRVLFLLKSNPSGFG